VRASKVLKDAKPFDAQEFLMQLAEGKTDLDAIPVPGGPPPARARGKKAHAAD
jgi:cytochrome c556